MERMGSAPGLPPATVSKDEPVTYDMRVGFEPE